MTWDRIAPLYDPGMKMLMLPFGGERKTRWRFLDAAGIVEGMRVLDVCCATGTLTRLAGERVGPGGRAVGIDWAPGMLSRAYRAGAARQKRPAEFVCADAAQLPFPDACFDCVLAFMALHEIETAARTEAVRECHRVLTTGGCLAVADYPALSSGGSLLLKMMLKLFEPGWAADFLRGEHLKVIGSMFAIEQTIPLLDTIIHITVARKATGGRCS
ncbi:MAG TPA: methyltransferase domain-containing protein [Planctomycetota bacterium]|nr:methyltransferase domain-containing protein [Planctomycetota bacterium]